MNANNNPKVSIVIPVYNGANFLGGAIDSALAQTYDNIEVVVVNDGSRDDGATERVAKAYGGSIRYYCKENGGVASALNYGIQKMTGEYFSWLSHDDLYEKNKIEEQVDKMLSLQGGNNIVVCNARTLFKSGIKKEALIDRNTFEFFDIFLGTEADVGINGCALLIPRKVLIESGGFNPELPVTQDYDLWYRLSTKHHCTFVLLEKSLVAYRIHEGQDSLQKQQLCLEAGDDLRHGILAGISRERFEEYFMRDRANLRHAWANYVLYRERGYTKTPSILLKSILQHYHEHDLERFYAMYASEVDTSVARGATHRKTAMSVRGRTLTAEEREQVEEEYTRILRSSAGDFPVRGVRPLGGSRPPKNMAIRLAWRLGESIRRDGVYLTGEKIVRAVHAKTAGHKE